ncbi:MAG: glycosyltransferase family 4 protein [Actinomycetota bacterium]
MRLALDVSAVPDRPVGAGVYTVALARGLAAEPDLDLHLITRQGDERWSAIAPATSVHAVVPTARPARLAWEQTGAARLARRIAPTCWHGPHYTAPLRAPVPTVVTVHDLTFFDHPEWHERTKVAFFRPMIRAAVRRADAIVCVSEHTAERLRTRLGPTSPIHVVPHGVDHRRFRPTEDPGPDLELLARHGITPPFVAFAGTIEPRKNLAALVGAFARLAPDRPDLRLVLAGGDGWGATEVRRAVADRGVATRVVRPGYLPDDALVALFRQAAVVAYPSREEGFGLNILEALACGAPLVTSRGSATEEVAGAAALLVDPDDELALAAAIRRALDDPAVASRLRQAGPEHAATFTWTRSVAGHLAAYQAVAAGMEVA